MPDIIIPSLPADLPENLPWNQVIAPEGSDIGKPEQWGYNYMLKQINASHRAINLLTELVSSLPAEQIAYFNSAMEDVTDIREAIDWLLSHLIDNQDIIDAINSHNADLSAHPSKPTLIDATATYEDGTFSLTSAQDIPQWRYMLRFTAPDDYHTGDVLRICDEDLEVATVSAPDKPAPDGIFAAGALVTLDVDGDNAKAFFKGGSGGGDEGLTLIYNALVTRATEGGLEVWPSLTGAPASYSTILACAFDGNIAAGCGYDGTAYNRRIWIIDTQNKSNRELVPFVGAIKSYPRMIAQVGEELIAYEGTASVASWIWEAIRVSTNTRRTLTNPSPPSYNFLHPPVYGNELVMAGGSTGISGYDNNGPVIKTVRAINPVTNTWRTFIDLQTARQFPMTGIVGDELIIAGGGTESNASVVTAVEAINLVTNTRRSLPNLMWARHIADNSTPASAAAEGYFVVASTKFASGATEEALKSIEVYYPATDTKSIFYKANKGTVNCCFALNNREFVYEQSVTGVTGVSRVTEVMDAYTGEVRKRLENPWDGSVGNAFVLVGTSLFAIGSGAGRVQMFETEILDNDKVTIPAPKAALGSRSAQLPAKVRLPVPSVYGRVDYPANTSIQLQGNDIFELPGLSTDAQTVEVKYLVQGGEYQL